MPWQLSLLPSLAAAGYPAFKIRSHLLFSAEPPVGMNDFAPSLARRTTLINPPRFCGPDLRKDSRLSVSPSKNREALTGTSEKHLLLSPISPQRENIMTRLPEDLFLSSAPQAFRLPSPVPGSTCGVPAESIPPGLNATPEALTGPRPASGSASAARSPARCGEKGCVFPAKEDESGLCSYHLKQQLEPALFSSWQPTWLLVNQPAAGFDGSQSARGRSRDRRRLAAQCKAFRQGLA
jgi:hypothetical protein